MTIQKDQAMLVLVSDLGLSKDTVRIAGQGKPRVSPGRINEPAGWVRTASEGWARRIPGEPGACIVD